MLQIRLTQKNNEAVAALVKDAQLDGLLTIPKVANLAIQKGLPLVRDLLVKQTQNKQKK